MTDYKLVQSWLSICPKACDVTRKDVLGTYFWEQECKQIMAMCIKLSVLCSEKPKKESINKCHLSSVSVSTSTLFLFCFITFTVVQRRMLRGHWSTFGTDCGRQTNSTVLVFLSVYTLSVVTHYDILHSVKPSIVAPDAHFCSRCPLSVLLGYYWADIVQSELHVRSPFQMIHVFCM